MFQLDNHSNESTSDTTHAKYCQEGNVMGSLVTNASAFLFPCKIEYSLICAVILFEMWKKVKTVKVKIDKETAKSPVSNPEKNTFNIGEFFFFLYLKHSLPFSNLQNLNINK